jgi:hypothetical protein
MQMVDPRQPRFGQAITGIALLLGFVMAWPPVVPIIAAVLGAASLAGGRANLYAYGFRLARRAFRLDPPQELEEAGPPRFANTVGFLFLATATAFLAAGLHVAAWTLSLIVSALALLAAATALCLGCEIYVVARRMASRKTTQHLLRS